MRATPPVGTGAAVSDVDTGAAQDAAAVLRIGSILPLTGVLSYFGPDMKNGVDLAVAELNAAANLGGQQLVTVEHFSQDSRTDWSEAPSAMNTLVGQGVSGVVGAAGSAITASILGIALQNEIVLVTPASTSPSLTDPVENDNKGYFYRVPPSDALQGLVLGPLVADDGCKTATIVAVDNPYGQGLARSFEATFRSLGGSIEETIFFPQSASTFSREIEQAAQVDSDAVVFIGYPGEGVPFVQQAYESGLMGASVFFFSEGVKAPEFVSAVGAEILEGLGGTSPAAGGRSEEWWQRFEDEFGHEPNLFAAESYDAAIAIGLAAIAAGSTDGAAIKDAMPIVWSAPGLKTSSVQEAIAALAAGQDIDWVGPSGDSSWDAFGDPDDGVYAHWIVRDGLIQEGPAFHARDGSPE